MAAAEASDDSNMVAAQLMDEPARVSNGGAEHPHGQVEAVVR